MKPGFSLVEVIVALVVLEVAILGAVGIVVVASRTMTVPPPRSWFVAPIYSVRTLTLESCDTSPSILRRL